MPWAVVFIPSYFVITILGFSISFQLRHLRETFPRVYALFAMALTGSCICICLFLILEASVMDVATFPVLHWEVNKAGPYIPLLVAVVFALGIFMFLLPGFHDAENPTSRRIPFLALAYLVSLFVFALFMMINVP